MCSAKRAFSKLYYLVKTAGFVLPTAAAATRAAAKAGVDGAPRVLAHNFALRHLVGDFGRLHGALRTGVGENVEMVPAKVDSTMV